MNKLFMNKHPADEPASFENPFCRQDRRMKVRQVSRSWTTPHHFSAPLPALFPVASQSLGSVPGVGHWIILKDSPSQQCRRTQGTGEPFLTLGLVV